MSAALSVRPATASDVPAMHRLRLSVRENRLSDPRRLSEESYRRYVDRGTAWVAVAGDRIAGFAVLDAADASVWALFVDRGLEGIGAGRALHDQLLRCAGERNLPLLNLTTEPGTRAEAFYRKMGWTEAGRNGSGELRFERLL